MGVIGWLGTFYLVTDLFRKHTERSISPLDCSNGFYPRVFQGHLQKESIIKYRLLRLLIGHIFYNII